MGETWEKSYRRADYHPKRLSCPFCGHLERLEIYEKGRAYRVTCEVCGANGPKAKSKSLATSRWNVLVDKRLGV